MAEIEKQFRNGFSRTVLDYYIERVRRIRAERSQKLLDISNKKEAEEYQRYVRNAIKKTFAPLPPKTPLNPKVTGVLKKTGFRVEKIVFESRPKFYVTGNLYIPDGLNKPVPAVLGTCGHSLIGKEEPIYQEFCLRLVKSGYVVFIFDPICQGERNQYYNFPDDLHVRKSCVAGHNMLGGQLSLIGEWFGTWRLWDGIRALDYLLSRPEVDSRHVGITGNSGGGTMTTWLWSMDSRFTMAAPSCFVSTFISNLENDNYADIEQCPQGVIGKGLEHADFYIAQAPKPVILLGQKYDFFDRRGLKEAYSEIKRFYGFFNAQDNIKLFIGNHHHGYYPDNQKQMLDFFSKTSGVKKIFKGNKLVTEERKDLWATPKGSVIEVGAVPAYELISEKAKNITDVKTKLSKQEIRKEIKKVLNLSDIGKDAPHYRVLRPYKVARYGIESKGTITSILRKTFAGKEKEKNNLWTLDVEKKIHLYLPHLSAEQDTDNDSLAKNIIKKNALYALDVRGTGESAIYDIVPANYTAGDKLAYSYGLMLGESYLGLQVYDVLRTLCLLRKEGASEINLYGRGYGALRALFVALIDGGINRVVLKNMPESFFSFTQTPIVEWSFFVFPVGILKKFDIPDCLKILGKKVKVVEPWDANMAG